MIADDPSQWRKAEAEPSTADRLAKLDADIQAFADAAEVGMLAMDPEIYRRQIEALKARCLHLKRET